MLKDCLYQVTDGIVFVLFVYGLFQRITGKSGNHIGRKRVQRYSTSVRCRGESNMWNAGEKNYKAISERQRCKDFVLIQFLISQGVSWELITILLLLLLLLFKASWKNNDFMIDRSSPKSTAYLETVKKQSIKLWFLPPYMKITIINPL